METTMTCSQASRATNEILAGTVKPSDTFFLIEIGASGFGSYGGDAVKSAAQSGPFAPHLRHLQSAPRSKVLFIRRPRSQGRNFYIALTNQDQPRIYHSELNDHADLLQLDIASLAPGQAPRINGSALSEIDELFVVCANGRHDPCCATHGAPVYNELVKQAGQETVWQTTHIGGHRMAATMITFPHGIVYGHLDPADADAVVSNQRAGSLLTHKYRGRGTFAGHYLDEEAHKAACAAEAVLRDELRAYAIDDLRLDAIDAQADHAWLTRFVDAAGTAHAAQVTVSMSAPRPTSCGDPPKPMPQHDVALLALP